ncbi:MAG: DUF1844 domain-containing protein [Candidatus Kapaibacteriota bacterium]|jgi:hypothetical protein
MTIDFSGIVQMFQIEGFTALGKIAHPMTGKTEKNLEQASFVIDLLAVLQEKTKGNLTDSEARLLDNALRDLRLNYVADNASPASSMPDSSGDLT